MADSWSSRVAGSADEMYYTAQAHPYNYTTSSFTNYQQQHQYNSADEASLHNSSSSSRGSIEQDHVILDISSNVATPSHDKQPTPPPVSVSVYSPTPTPDITCVASTSSGIEAQNTEENHDAYFHTNDNPQSTNNELRQIVDEQASEYPSVDEQETEDWPESGSECSSSACNASSCVDGCSGGETEAADQERDAFFPDSLSNTWRPTWQEAHNGIQYNVEGHALDQPNYMIRHEATSDTSSRNDGNEQIEPYYNTRSQAHPSPTQAHPAENTAGQSTTEQSGTQRGVYACCDCDSVFFHSAVFREHCKYEADKMRRRVLAGNDELVDVVVGGEGRENYTHGSSTIPYTDADVGYRGPIDPPHIDEHSRDKHREPKKKRWAPRIVNKIFKKRKRMKNRIQSAHTDSSQQYTEAEDEDDDDDVESTAKRDRAKSHVCGYCQRKFADKSTLNTHIYTHTGERKYKCSYCNHGCIKNWNLKMHLMTNHGIMTGSSITMQRLADNKMTSKIMQNKLRTLKTSARKRTPIYRHDQRPLNVLSDSDESIVECDGPDDVLPEDQDSSTPGNYVGLSRAAERDTAAVVRGIVEQSRARILRAKPQPVMNTNPPQSSSPPSSSPPCGGDLSTHVITPKDGSNQIFHCTGCALEFKLMKDTDGETTSLITKVIPLPPEKETIIPEMTPLLSDITPLISEMTPENITHPTDNTTERSEQSEESIRKSGRMIIPRKSTEKARMKVTRVDEPADNKSDPLICEFCQEKFTNPWKYQSHLLHHQARRDVLTTPVEVGSHIVSEGVEGSQGDSVRRERPRRKQTLIKRCDDTYSEFNTFDSNRLHSLLDNSQIQPRNRSQGNVSMFQCQFCSCRLPTRREMMNHLQNQHDDIVTLPVSTPPQGRIRVRDQLDTFRCYDRRLLVWKCSFCGKGYMYRSSLVRHLKVYHKADLLNDMK